MGKKVSDEALRKACDDVIQRGSRQDVLAAELGISKALMSGAVAKRRKELDTLKKETAKESKLDRARAAAGAAAKVDGKPVKADIVPPTDPAALEAKDAEFCLKTIRTTKRGLVGLIARPLYGKGWRRDPDLRELAELNEFTEETIKENAVELAKELRKTVRGNLWMVWGALLAEVGVVGFSAWIMVKSARQQMSAKVETEKEEEERIKAENEADRLKAASTPEKVQEPPAVPVPPSEERVVVEKEGHKPVALPVDTPEMKASIEHHDKVTSEVVPPEDLPGQSNRQ